MSELFYYHDQGVTLHHGNCLDILAHLPDESVDAVCTDPPYGLANTDPQHVADTIVRWVNGDREYIPEGAGFMGKAWDAFVPPVAVWDECLRVLKPGGHVLAFAGSRTVDLMTLGLRLAGFDIRDSIAWLYGSGFPKSLDVSKAIDKARDDKAEILAVTTRLAELAAAAGITRADIDTHMGTSDMGGWWLSTLRHRCACPSVDNWTRLRDLIPGATELDDDVWHLNGRKGTWGSERVDRVVSLPGGNAVYQPTQRVESSGTPATPDAEKWQGWGTALKPGFEPVVVARKPLVGTVAANVLAHGTGGLNIDACRIGSDSMGGYEKSGSFSGQVYADGQRFRATPASGRWPANVVLDEGQAAALDQGSDCGPSRYFKTVSSTLEEWERRGGRSTRDANTSAGKTGASTSNSWRTDGSGSRQTDPSHRATTSTTETTTPSTTTSETCNFSPPRNTGSTTPETARTTPSLTELSTADASGATPCSPCQSLPCDGLAPTRDTAETARANTSANGEQPTASDTTPTCAPIDALTERFLYQAKAPKRERPNVDGIAHPCVKPLTLMRWLVRLVTPPGGVVLDPFAGSGATAEACMQEGFDCIAIERETDYLPLILQRIHRNTTTPPDNDDQGDLLDLLGEGEIA